jgi:transcriptional regulator with XRE-family HTH domain
VSVVADTSGLSYQARARIADNLLVARRRAGFSQVALGEIAIVSFCRISEIENDRVVGMLDTYVRLAGALGLTLSDLLAGVQWMPSSVKSGYEAGTPLNEARSIPAVAAPNPSRAPSGPGLDRANERHAMEDPRPAAGIRWPPIDRAR